MLLFEYIIQSFTSSYGNPLTLPLSIWMTLDQLIFFDDKIPMYNIFKFEAPGVNKTEFCQPITQLHLFQNVKLVLWKIHHIILSLWQ